jgi:hypothetical protein
MRDERKVCTEHYQETDSGLSIGHVGSATWRHISPISASGVLLEQLKSIITRKWLVRRAQCLEH